MLDEMDVKILRILQRDCTRSVADIGKEVGLSTTPCWRRIQKLEEAGVIQRRVAILDAPQVNAGVASPRRPCIGVDAPHIRPGVIPDPYDGPAPEPRAGSRWRQR